MSGLLGGDPARIGYALLRPDPPRGGPLSVSIRFLDGSYLGAEGRRTRVPHLFVGEPQDRPGTYALGPPVTAHVLEGEVVTLADEEGVSIGTAVWEGIRPPPGPGQGVLLGTRDRRTATLLPASCAPVAVPPVTAEPAPMPVLQPTIEAADPFPASPSPAHRGPAVAVTFLALLAAVAAWSALVLSGRVGWQVDPAALSLAAESSPKAASRLSALWYAKPFSPLLSMPFVIASMPDGLTLRQERDDDGWVLRAAISSGPPQPGRRDIRVPIAFPLGGTAAGRGVDVSIEVAAPRPAHLDVAQPPPPPARSTVDDAACDRAAGNRLDPDHPSGGGFVDDVLASPPAAIETGILACDDRKDRDDADRRLIVQRGRLFAARAVARGAGGDTAGGRADMNEALEDWRAGSALGSGFADSLLGAYMFGTFNRPALTFVQSDDAAATEAWRRGTVRGSVVAQRNYAAQLLAGHGVPADPARALSLLRDALARGDEMAAGVLGVALYTGYPPGVPRDAAEGWRLIVRAQCLDRPSADLLAREIARGARPPGDRQSCSR